jgi:hypothetical protein
VGGREPATGRECDAVKRKPMTTPIRDEIADEFAAILGTAPKLVERLTALDELFATPASDA